MTNMIIILYMIMVFFIPQLSWSWGWFIIALIFQGVNEAISEIKYKNNPNEFIDNLDDGEKEEVYQQLQEWRNEDDLSNDKDLES